MPAGPYIAVIGASPALARAGAGRRGRRPRARRRRLRRHHRRARRGDGRRQPRRARGGRHRHRDPSRAPIAARPTSGCGSRSPPAWASCATPWWSRTADAVVAVGGAYGTLSEIALALNAGIGVVGYDTWPIEGIELADTPAAAVERALELAADAEAA